MALTPIESFAGAKNKHPTTRCICDCGNETQVTTGDLRFCGTISCGCANVDKPGLQPTDVRNRSNATHNRRRAREIGAGGSFTPEQITELYSKQSGCCANCGTKLGKRFHRDHKMPLSLGGSNDIMNIELLCQSCNQRKHAKDPIAWANENGRLI